MTEDVLDYFSSESLASEALLVNRVVLGDDHLSRNHLMKRYTLFYDMRGHLAPSIRVHNRDSRPLEGKRPSRGRFHPAGAVVN